MRVLGLDFGSKTVGAALSDPLGITAQGLEIINREKENHMRKTYRRIDEIISCYDVGAIVLGYPKNMNNTVGDRAKKTEEFKSDLEKRTCLPVFLWDERLTTVEAEQTMIAADVRREDRKKYVDKIAAVLILQGWLDANAGLFEELASKRDS
ncbi:MAG: Holliday junction resolvase RuvX [Lachnospiraceae bacterium]|jgi:putative Holliday junction resolvase